MKRGILFAIFLVNLGTVFAYIDPGTTGMVIGGGIWPYIVLVLGAISGFFLKYLINPIKRGISKLCGKKKH